MKIIREPINLKEISELKVDECSSFGGCCCKDSNDTDVSQ